MTSICNERHSCLPNFIKKKMDNAGENGEILLREDRRRYGSPRGMEREAFICFLTEQFRDDTLYRVKKTMRDYDVPEEIIAEERVRLAAEKRLESLDGSGELMDGVDREYLRRIFGVGT